MSLSLVLLLSWSITVLIGTFAVWLFFRYGQLVARTSGLEPRAKPRRTSRGYDVPISLGSNCEVAHQLSENGYRPASYPFDWLVLPFDALCALLERHFAGF